MSNSALSDALKIIIARSPNASKAALELFNVYPDILQIAYNEVADIALRDERATFTPEEKVLVAGAMEVVDDSKYTYMLRVRLTEHQKQKLFQQAEIAGKEVSPYVRDALFGGVND